MKPVVVHIIQHFKPGGIEMLVIEMLKRNSRYNMHIIALEGTQSAALEQFPVLVDFPNRIHCLNKPQGMQWPLVKTLRGLLRQLGAGACISHHIGPLFYTTLAKTGLGLCHLHTEHDAWHLDDPKAAQLQHWCLKMGRPTVIADAHCVAQALLKKFPFNQPHVIHNGIDIERFSPGSMSEAREYLNLPSEALIMGCAARLEPVKRIHRLIDALHELPETVHLAIAGSGSERLALMQHANNLKVTHRVHFLGFQSSLELFYRAIDLFCLVSEHEGLPLSSLEAQACGVPVVLSDVGGSCETVCPNTGMILINDDPMQLLNAIKYQLVRKTNSSPRGFITQHFSLDHMLANYEALLEQALYREEVA